MKQTAVEWLVEQLHSGKELSTIIRQAKEMEKEQIINACNSAYYSGETYYNETFKSE